MADRALKIPYQILSNTLLTDSIQFSMPCAYIIHVNECEGEGSQVKQVQTLTSARKGEKIKRLYHARSLAMAIPTADLTGSKNHECQVECW